MLPQDKPFLTLLPLAPKVFALQKRFSATPTFFFQAAGSLNVDIAHLHKNAYTRNNIYHKLPNFN
jgi:hypothetical protein